MDPSKDPGIQIVKMFIDTCVFGHQPDSLMLPENAAPKITGFDTEVSLKEMGDRGICQVILSTHPGSSYELKLGMTALVRVIPGQENMTIREYLASGNCVAALFPFLREAIANITGRGRFGPVFLDPINIREFAKQLQSQNWEPIAPPPPATHPLPPRPVAS
jgi:preprotein translocase subunit SecB